MDMLDKKRFVVLLLLMFTLGVCVGLVLPKNSGFSPDPAAVAAFSMGTADALPSPEEEPFTLVALTPTPIPEESPVPSADGFTLEVIREETPKPSKGRILIYHTHTYEAYEKQAGTHYEETTQWRTANPDFNVVRVGKELAALLRGLGFDVVHDTTPFEPPVLDSAYTRSLEMLLGRRTAGENFDLCIDLHRDAYAKSQTGPNTVSFGGQELARLMFLIGKGEGQTGQGFAEKPDWESNLLYAQKITDEINAQVPGLCKNVMLKSGRYNQHVSVGCVLIEVGNNRNSIQEALRSMPYLADAIRQALFPE